MVAPPGFLTRAQVEELGPFGVHKLLALSRLRLDAEHNLHEVPETS